MLVLYRVKNGFHLQKFWSIFYLIVRSIYSAQFLIHHPAYLLKKVEIKRICGGKSTLCI
jgi:hypothetical protein